MGAMNKTVALMIKFMKTIREDIFSDFAEGALKNIELIKKNIVEHWKRDWVESWTVQHMRSVVQDDDVKAKAKAVAMAATDLSDMVIMFEDLKKDGPDELDLIVGDKKIVLSSLKADAETLVQQGKLCTCTWSVWALVLDRGKDAQPNQRQTLASKMKAKIATEVGNTFFTGITGMLDAWVKDGIVRSAA